MSEDLGATAAGFSQNFAYGTLIEETGDYVQLVDDSHNTSSTSPEAVYVNALVVSAGSTLNLNGLNLYARAAEINGTIANGTVSQLPTGGGSLPLDTPTPGDIATAGASDTWTTFARAGSSLEVVVDPGSGLAGGPISPFLGYAQIELFDPSGNLLSTVNSTTSGALFALLAQDLPVDGDYSIEVHAAPGHVVTGNYVVGAYNATPNVQALNINQAEAGKIAAPFDFDEWTFSASANTQIQFNLASGSSTGLVYSLTGPNGYSAFSNATTSSPLIDLPTGGAYTISVQGPLGQIGTYGFTLTQTNVTPLVLNTSNVESAAGSGQYQLYTVQVSAANPLAIDLTDPDSADHNELFASFGQPPTLADYQDGSTASGASQSLLIPDADAGTWYVLVYSESVAAPPSSFTLQATSGEVVLTGSTPTQSATNIATSLTITGAGFTTGSAVSLISSNGTTYAPATSEVDLPTQMTVTFAASSLPAGTYSLKIPQTDGSTAELSNVLSMAAYGAPHLTTNPAIPDPMTRHIAETLYIDYSNTGTAPMPAPLLILTATNPLGQQGALFTLNPALQGEGLWTNTTPVGYSQSVEVLATGATPGILEPGKSESIPVYYAGWLTSQWDFSQSTLNFSLQVIQANDPRPMDWNGATYVTGTASFYIQESTGGETKTVPFSAVAPWVNGTPQTTAQITQELEDGDLTAFAYDTLTNSYYDLNLVTSSLQTLNLSVANEPRVAQSPPPLISAS